VLLNYSIAHWVGKKHVNRIDRCMAGITERPIGTVVDIAAGGNLPRAASGTTSAVWEGSVGAGISGMSAGYRVEGSIRVSM